MPEDEKNSVYDVGYGKPPEKTRFAKGQSGNPKGRPRGAKNFATVLEKELNAHVIVTENGQRKKIQKREAMIKQLVNKGAAGDYKATVIVLNETRPLDCRIGNVSEAPAEYMSAAAQNIVNGAFERFMRTKLANTPSAEVKAEVQDDPPTTASSDSKPPSTITPANEEASSSTNPASITQTEGDSHG